MIIKLKRDVASHRHKVTFLNTKGYQAKQEYGFYFLLHDELKDVWVRIARSNINSIDYEDE